MSNNIIDTKSSTDDTKSSTDDINSLTDDTNSLTYNTDDDSIKLDSINFDEEVTNTKKNKQTIRKPAGNLDDLVTLRRPLPTYENPFNPKYNKDEYSNSETIFPTRYNDIFPSQKERTKPIYEPNKNRVSYITRKMYEEPVSFIKRNFTRKNRSVVAPHGGKHKRTQKKTKKTKTQKKRHLRKIRKQKKSMKY